MRPIAFLVLTLGLIAVGLYSASAKPPAGQPTPSNASTFEPFAPATPTAPATSSVPVRVRAEGFAFEEPSSIKSAYLRLAQQYAELMTEDELVAEFVALERKIETKQSENTLQSVRQMLEQIAERYPSTPAAARALKMLEQLDAPIPDDSIPADAVEEATPASGSNESAFGF